MQGTSNVYQSAFFIFCTRSKSVLLLADDKIQHLIDVPKCILSEPNNPESTKTAWNLISKQLSLDSEPISLTHLGKRCSPQYDLPVEETQYILAFSDSFTNKTNSWYTVENVLNDYKSHKLLFKSSHVLQILQNLLNSNFNLDETSSISIQQSEEAHIELQSKLELAPHIQCIPLPSSTIKPFTQTNLVVFESTDNHYMLVDPSPSNEAYDRFKAVLKKRIHGETSLKVFITHHHRDHIEGIPIIEELYPNATLIAHKATLDRIQTKLAKEGVLGNEVIKIGSNLEVQVIETLGHTDGHMTLLEPKSKTLIAGDHIVGYGSAVLDSSCGDMRLYFQSTHHLILIAPKLAIPAHGPPSYNPVELLRGYLIHRQKREDLILELYLKGSKTAEEIVSIAYKDIPQDMWKFALRNVELHLRKLKEEGKLE